MPAHCGGASGRRVRRLNIFFGGVDDIGVEGRIVEVDMDKSDVKHLIDVIDAVPPLPLVVSKVVEVADNPNSSAQDLANIICEDTGLTARVLKLINSSFYGFSRRISTVTESVILLGFEVITNIVIWISVARHIGTKESQVLDRQRFWQHSLGAAASAKILSQLIGYPNPEEAFIAGLLHDIGKIFFDEYVSDEYAAVVSRMDEGERNELRAERQVLGTDHAAVGQMLLKKWRLPQVYQMTTRYHHAPLRYEARLSTSIGRLVGAVHLADVFAKMHGYACDAHAYIPAVDPRVWKLLQLSEEDGSRTFLMFAEELKRAKEFFGIACSDELGDIKLAGGGEVKQVLLVSRHEPPVSTVRILLTAAGFDVACGILTRDGIVLPPGAEPHVVVLDLDEIGSDLGSIITFITALQGATPVKALILQNAPAAPNEARLYEKQGVFFLRKPFRAVELLGELRDVLRQKAESTC